MAERQHPPPSLWDTKQTTIAATHKISQGNATPEEIEELFRGLEERYMGRERNKRSPTQWEAQKELVSRTIRDRLLFERTSPRDAVTRAELEGILPQRPTSEHRYPPLPEDIDIAISILNDPGQIPPRFGHVEFRAPPRTRDYTNPKVGQLGLVLDRSHQVGVGHSSPPPTSDQSGTRNTTVRASPADLPFVLGTQFPTPPNPTNMVGTRSSKELQTREIPRTVRAEQSTQKVTAPQGRDTQPRASGSPLSDPDSVCIITDFSPQERAGTSNKGHQPSRDAAETNRPGTSGHTHATTARRSRPAARPTDDDPYEKRPRIRDHPPPNPRLLANEGHPRHAPRASRPKSPRHAAATRTATMIDLMAPPTKNRVQTSIETSFARAPLTKKRGQSPPAGRWRRQGSPTKPIRAEHPAVIDISASPETPQRQVRCAPHRVKNMGPASSRMKSPARPARRSRFPHRPRPMVYSDISDDPVTAPRTPRSDPKRQKTRPKERVNPHPTPKQSGETSGKKVYRPVAMTHRPSTQERKEAIQERLSQVAATMRERKLKETQTSTHPPPTAPTVAPRPPKTDARSMLGRLQNTKEYVTEQPKEVPDLGTATEGSPHRRKSVRARALPPQAIAPGVGTAIGHQATAEAGITTIHPENQPSLEAKGRGRPSKARHDQTRKKDVPQSSTTRDPRGTPTDSDSEGLSDDTSLAGWQPDPDPTVIIPDQRYYLPFARPPQKLAPFDNGPNPTWSIGSMAGDFQGARPVMQEVPLKELFLINRHFDLHPRDPRIKELQACLPVRPGIIPGKAHDPEPTTDPATPYEAETNPLETRGQAPGAGTDQAEATKANAIKEVAHTVAEWRLPYSRDTDVEEWPTQATVRRLNKELRWIDYAHRCRNTTPPVLRNRVDQWMRYATRSGSAPDGTSHEGRTPIHPRTNEILNERIKQGLNTYDIDWLMAMDWNALYTHLNSPEGTGERRAAREWFAQEQVGLLAASYYFRPDKFHRVPNTRNHTDPDIQAARIATDTFMHLLDEQDLRSGNIASPATNGNLQQIWHVANTTPLESTALPEAARGLKPIKITSNLPISPWAQIPFFSGAHLCGSLLQAVLRDILYLMVHWHHRDPERNMWDSLGKRLHATLTTGEYITPQDLLQVWTEIQSKMEIQTRRVNGDETHMRVLLFTSFTVALKRAPDCALIVRIWTKHIVEQAYSNFRVFAWVMDQPAGQPFEYDDLEAGPMNALFSVNPAIVDDRDRPAHLYSPDIAQISLYHAQMIIKKAMAVDRIPPWISGALIFFARQLNEHWGQPGKPSYLDMASYRRAITLSGTTNNESEIPWSATTTPAPTTRSFPPHFQAYMEEESSRIAKVRQYVPARRKPYPERHATPEQCNRESWNQDRRHILEAKVAKFGPPDYAAQGVEPPTHLLPIIQSRQEKPPSHLIAYLSTPDERSEEIRERHPMPLPGPSAILEQRALGTRRGGHLLPTPYNGIRKFGLRPEAITARFDTAEPSVGANTAPTGTVGNGQTLTLPPAGPTQRADLERFASMLATALLHEGRSPDERLAGVNPPAETTTRIVSTLCNILQLALPDPVPAPNNQPSTSKGGLPRPCIPDSPTREPPGERPAEKAPPPTTGAARCPSITAPANTQQMQQHPVAPDLLPTTSVNHHRMSTTTTLSTQQVQQQLELEAHAMPPGFPHPRRSFTRGSYERRNRDRHQDQRDRHGPREQE